VVFPGTTEETAEGRRINPVLVLPNERRESSRPVSTRRDATPTGGVRRSVAPAERLSLGSRVAARVGLSALVWGGSAGLGVALLLAALGFRDPLMLTMVVAAAIAAGAAAFVAVRRVFARRLTRVANFVEQRVRSRGGKEVGSQTDDELERVEIAVDRLLASMDTRTSQSSPGSLKSPTPHAGLIRPTPSAASLKGVAEQAQREAMLARDLTSKTAELAQRLAERNLLFEVLRESAASQNLSNVLDALVTRLGPVLRLREVAVLLKKSDGSFQVAAAWGFPDPKAVIGRSILPGEGVAVDATNEGRSVLIDDVTQAPQYLAFWGQVAREGSFLSVPIRAANNTIGALVLTRPPADPVTETETAYVEAIADQVALAIHNAQLFARLEELSTTDELTGLPNRRYFNDRLAREMSQARRWGHPLAVLVVDIDHFKKLNDREGHAAGDRALIAVGARLRAALREVDVVARWGGEEFTVILERTKEPDALVVAEKLRKAVEELVVDGAAGQPDGKLTVSIGVAELTEGEDAASLVQRADRAVYQAKKSGRNRVSIPPSG
jgi:diguanylate cyclase (GGDEF)-like protein